MNEGRRRERDGDRERGVPFLLVGFMREIDSSVKPLHAATIQFIVIHYMDGCLSCILK